MNYLYVFKPTFRNGPFNSNYYYTAFNPYKFYPNTSTRIYGWSQCETFVWTVKQSETIDMQYSSRCAVRPLWMMYYEIKKVYRSLCGAIHRDNGPAIEYTCGRTEWYKNNCLHRENGPATFYNGQYNWMYNGVRHRADGPAIIDSDDIGFEWHQIINGISMLHRENGPAARWNGWQKWYYKNQLHCENGPAVINQDGSKLWYYHGKPVKPYSNFNRK